MSNAVRRGQLQVMAALAVVILPLALSAQWWWAPVPDGRRFRPRPDALEYAAGAQSIAQSFTYRLQVGPYRVRPRYPPGWPLLLAVAVRLGVPGDELWRVTGVLGAGLACLLGCATAGAVLRLHGALSRAALAGALTAGLVVGLGWALAPVAVAVGRVALSDEPTALVTAVSMLATGAAFLGLSATLGGGERGRAPGTRLAAAALGGLAFGLLAGMRPVSAALLAPALCVIAAFGWRAQGGRETLRRAAAWIGGAILVPGLVMVLLWRSHLSPWQWSGYAFWAPRWYADIHDTFNWRFALHGSEPFARGSDDHPIPNVVFYAKILLGLPGLEPASYLGLYWPIAGWVAAALLWWRCRGRPRLLAGGLAALAALAAHLVLFSLYFFPAARFMLVPLMVPLVALGIGCGLAIGGGGGNGGRGEGRGSKGVGEDRGDGKDGGRGEAGGDGGDGRDGAGGGDRTTAARRLGAGLAAAALSAMIIYSFLDFRAAAVEDTPDEDVRGAFASWRRLPDGARAAAEMPFNPVEAQALGLLPPAVVARIHNWGRLPATVHVRRLRILGVIPRQ